MTVELTGNIIKKLISLKCKQCKLKYFDEWNLDEDKSNYICKKCNGTYKKKYIDLKKGVPKSTDFSRIGDNQFKNASNEWWDFLKKIDEENPNNNMNLK